MHCVSAQVEETVVKEWGGSGFPKRRLKVWHFGQAPGNKFWHRVVLQEGIDM